MSFRVSFCSCVSPVVCSTDRSKAVVPVLVLLLVALWFILRSDLMYGFPVSFCSCVFFSPFSIAITSLGEERANLNAFRTFVRFVLVWIPSAPAYGVYVSQLLQLANFTLGPYS